MLNTIRATALTAALLLLASPAAAEPFQSFLKMCVMTDADGAAAARAAGDLGWKAVATETMPDMGEGVRDPSIYINFDMNRPETAPETIELLVTGWADGDDVMDAPGLVMDICGVLSPGADADALTGQMAAQLGEAGAVDKDYTAWIYSRQNGRLVPETALMEAEDEEIFAAVRQRRLYVVYLLNEDDVVGVMVGALRVAGQAVR